MSGPFFFLLTNHTSNDSALNCLQVSCHLNSCWANKSTARGLGSRLGACPSESAGAEPSLPIPTAVEATIVTTAASTPAAAASTVDSLTGQGCHCLRDPKLPY